MTAAKTFVASYLNDLDKNNWMPSYVTLASLLIYSQTTSQEISALYFVYKLIIYKRRTIPNVVTALIDL